MATLRLIVMSRAPVPGLTKTRLIPALGAEGAAAFHAACLMDLLAEADTWRREWAGRGAAFGLTLSITPPGSEAAFRAAGVDWPAHANVAAQRGDTLGERMRDALREGLAVAERVLLVGCDLPLLTWAHWEAAARALDDQEAVFGPAADGGYYLIGVRRPAAGRAWEGMLEAGDGGGSTVLERALAQARHLGLSVAQIATLPDADTPEDLRRVLDHPLAKLRSARRSLTLLRERSG